MSAPPLSKSYLLGKKEEHKLLINSEDFYKTNTIELKLATRVERIDPAESTLTTTSGETISYQKLVLAIGARARKFPSTGSELSGVHTLRSMRDAAAIKAQIQNAKKAVVIGSGFIGMETAAVLAQKKIETTMVYPGDRMMAQIFTPEMSALFEQEYLKKGVQLRKQSKVQSLEGQGHVSHVVLGDGQKIEADLVIAGVGAEPNTEIAERSGIAVQNGIIINEYLETDKAGIYSAGDVARYKDVLFGKERRTEHWDNAVAQGQHLGFLLTGERRPFVHVPYFFSDFFEFSYEFWGDAEGADQIIYRGVLEQMSFSVWWMRNGEVIAAWVMDRPEDERNLAPQWIEQRKRVDRMQLENENISLADI